MTTPTSNRSCWTRLAIALIIAIVTVAFLYSMLDAQELPTDPAGPVIIPTATMHPAPTPSDGDGFVILWHSVYLPIVEVNYAP